MFAKQQLQADQKFETEVMKEEIMATNKRLELKCKAMKTHNLRIEWTEDWLKEKLVTHVIKTGHEIVNNRME